MVSIVRQYWHSMQFSSRMAKVGMGMTAAAFGANALASDERKRGWVAGVLKGYRAVGVKEEQVPDSQLKGRMWQGIRSMITVTQASPLFYFAYQAIHRSDLSWGGHLLRAGGRGISGSFASVPMLAVFYGMATVLLPVIQSRAMDGGMDAREAKSRAEGIVFLAIGSPLEFGVEAVGCGIRPGQFALGPTLLGTAFITGRLAAGVLTQYRAVESKDQGKSHSDFAVTLVGTTFTQHGVNAVMQTLTHGTGVRGIGRYILTGSTSGVGTPVRAMKQLGGTLFQRILFSWYWNELNHQDNSPPEWLR